MIINNTRTRSLPATSKWGWMVALLIPLAACSGSTSDTTQSPAEAGPVTNEVEPATLRMASPYCDDDLVMGTGSRYNPALAQFVDQVKSRSGGAISIEVVTRLDGGDDFCQMADGEQQVIQGVADGEFDLAWAGTRVFDTFGVSGFAALHAPFLVDSYPLQAAILESDIPERLLGELDDIGVRGLAVLAGGLRKPVGVEGPLVGPDDWEGITFQYYRSDTQAGTVTALGAVPTDVVAGVRDDGLSQGEIDAHEHGLLIYVVRGNPSLAPYVTANVNLWPETTVLLANPETLNRLSDTQVGWLSEAATDASAQSARLQDIEDKLVIEACDQGARFAEASDTDLTALRTAVEPVYDQLRSDPLTAELIADIEAFKETVTAEPLSIPDSCTGEAPSR